jgi:hypothetical protein
VIVVPLALTLVACQDYNLNKTAGRDGADDTADGTGSDTDGDDTDDFDDGDPDNCGAREIPAADLAQNDECYTEGPTVGSFTPVVEWSKATWRTEPSSANIMMMPAVGSLTDDDGDGDADADDVPDIVVVTYGDVGTLRANVERERQEARAWQALLLLAIASGTTRSGRSLPMCHRLSSSTRCLTDTCAAASRCCIAQPPQAPGP